MIVYSQACSTCLTSPIHRNWHVKCFLWFDNICFSHLCSGNSANVPLIGLFFPYLIFKITHPFTFYFCSFLFNQRTVNLNRISLEGESRSTTQKCTCDWLADWIKVKRDSKKMFEKKMKNVQLTDNNRDHMLAWLAIFTQETRDLWVLQILHRTDSGKTSLKGLLKCN